MIKSGYSDHGFTLPYFNILFRIRKTDEDYRNKFKSKKKVTELMKEIRDEALTTSIDVAQPDNKGLKLMQKMGFKIGTGLGPEGEGRKVPVPIGRFKGDHKGKHISNAFLRGCCYYTDQGIRYY